MVGQSWLVPIEGYLIQCISVLVGSHRGISVVNGRSIFAGSHRGISDANGRSVLVGSHRGISDVSGRSVLAGSHRGLSDDNVGPFWCSSRQSQE